MGKDGGGGGGGDDIIIQFRDKTGKKVKMKTYEALKKLFRAKEIRCRHVSDDGEYMSVAIPYEDTGGYQSVKGFWTSDLGEEFLVVDHPNVITKDEYERWKILFEE